MGIKIFVHKDESIDRAIRRFKTACEKAGIKKEFKERSRYEKPSDARRKEARKRLRQIQKNTLNAGRNKEKDMDKEKYRDEKIKF